MVSDEVTERRKKAEAKAQRLKLQEQGVIPTKDGGVKACLYNVQLLIERSDDWDGVLAFSEFTLTIEKRKPPPYDNGIPGAWTEQDNIYTTNGLARHCDLALQSSRMVSDAVSAIAHKSKCHPVREYLNALVWDGTERIDRWLSVYAGAENAALTRSFARKFLISAVARVRDPGCKMDTVLESRVCRASANQPLPRYSLPRRGSWMRG